MSEVTAWIYTPIGQALGWTLLHFVWEGAALALLLAAALWLAGANPRRRYALACTVLAFMPVVFGGTVALLWSRRAAPAQVQSAGVAATQQANGTADLTELPPAPPRLSASGIVYRWGWAVPIWFAGVMLFYLRAMAGLLGVRQMRSQGLCAVSPHWQKRFSRLSERVGITQTVALFESCMVDTPVLIGYLRPMVLLPVGCLTGLSANQIECILLHELAHVRRHDYLVNLLQSAVEGLLFYHPAVWWMSGVVRAERENCCDDVVVDLIGDARSYALALAAMEERRALVGVLAASGGNLMKRIRRLTGAQVVLPSSAAPAAWAAVLLVVFASGLLAVPAKKLAPIHSRRTVASGVPLPITHLESEPRGPEPSATVSNGFEQEPVIPQPVTHQRSARVFSSADDPGVSVIVPLRAELRTAVPPGTRGGNVLEIDTAIEVQRAQCGSLKGQLEAESPMVVGCVSRLRDLEMLRAQAAMVRTETVNPVVRLAELRQERQMLIGLHDLELHLKGLQRNSESAEAAQAKRSLDEMQSRLALFASQHPNAVEVQSYANRTGGLIASIAMVDRQISAVEDQVAASRTATNEVSVQSERGSGAVTVLAPLEPGERSRVFAQIQTAGSRVVSSVEEEIGATWAKVFKLQPGSYHLEVVVQNLQSKARRTSKVDFTVE